jgi:hypothetical protein
VISTVPEPTCADASWAPGGGFAQSLWESATLLGRISRSRCMRARVHVESNEPEFSSFIGFLVPLELSASWGWLVRTEMWACLSNRIPGVRIPGVVGTWVQLDSVSNRSMSTPVRMRACRSACRGRQCGLTWPIKRTGGRDNGRREACTAHRPVAWLGAASSSWLVVG